jgi:hypothetical protein
MVLKKKNAKRRLTMHYSSFFEDSFSFLPPHISLKQNTFVSLTS